VLTSRSNSKIAEPGTGDVLIPLIRAAATIGFAIAPCSVGFVIIAVSEHLVRSIMVGDDPEMLMSDLQNQFPNDAIEIIANEDAGLIAKVVDSIERPDGATMLPIDVAGNSNIDGENRVATIAAVRLRSGYPESPCSG
jgi:hypothetical protein